MVLTREQIWCIIILSVVDSYCSQWFLGCNCGDGERVGVYGVMQYYVDIYHTQRAVIVCCVFEVCKAVSAACMMYMSLCILSATSKSRPQ